MTSGGRQGLEESSVTSRCDILLWPRGAGFDLIGLM